MTFADRFKDRKAIVTGGESGLGKAVAARIFAEGGKVVLWDVNTELLDAVAAETNALGVLTVDVSNAEEVQAATEKSLALLGRVDILITAAGITGATGPVWEFPIDSWLRVMDINLNGLFYCCRSVVPHMLANNYGRIVNVASVAGKEGNPNASAYSASK